MKREQMIEIYLDGEQIFIRGTLNIGHMELSMPVEVIRDLLAEMTPKGFTVSREGEGNA